MTLGRRPVRVLGALSVVGAALAPGPTSGVEGLSGVGGSGLLDVRSAEGLPHGSVRLETDALTYSLAAEAVPDDSVSVRLVDGGLQLAVGLGGWSEWWVRARFLARDRGSGDLERFPGDGRAGVKLLASLAAGRVHVALAADRNLWFGDRSRGGATDASDPAVTALVTVLLPLAGRDVGARLHLNAGYTAHGDDRGRTFDGSPLHFLPPVYPSGQNDRIDLRGALELRAVSTALFLELVMDRLRHPDVAYAEGPRFFNAGFRVALPASLSLRVATRASLAHDDESTTTFRPAEELYPDWQWGAAIGWTLRAQEE